MKIQHALLCAGALAAASLAQEPAPPTPKWLGDITRVAYTDLGNARFSGDWPDKVIADMAAAGVQLFFSRVHSGSDWEGLAWKSEFGIPDPKMGERDATRYLVDLCHSNHIRYLGYYWAQREPASLAEAHPDWCGVNSHGKPSRYFCINTPYRQLVRNRIVELVAKEGVDGIFFDMFHARADECYCACCKARFRQQTGQEAPTVENFENPVWRKWVEFRYRSIEEAMLEFNRAIKAANPEAALMVNTWNAWVYQDELKCRNSIRVIENVDAILEETGWYDTVDPSFCAFPTLYNFMSWHLAGLAKEKPAFMWARGAVVRLPIGYTETLTRQMVMLANGAVPAQSVPGRAVMARYMGDLAEREAYVRSSRPLRWCGLLVSEKTEMWYGRKEPQERYIKGIYGAYQIMLERHLPVVLVTDRDLERGDLAGLSVLVAPNAAALSKKECEQLRRFVSAGGGLVATYETAMYDEEGQPLADFRLGDLLNAHKVGEFDGRAIRVGWDPLKIHTANWYVPATHRWAQGEVRVAMERCGVTDPLGTVHSGLPLIGRLLEVEPVKGKRSDLRVTTSQYNDQLKKMENTNHSGVVENQFGAGKVFYFPADLTWSYFRLGDPHAGGLLVQAIREAAGQISPVEVTAPSIVQTTTFVQGKRLVVHLLNDISSLGRSQNVKGESLRERTEVLPIHDITVTFRDPRLQRFTLIPSGAVLPFEQAPQGQVVKVPPLQVHALVVAEER
jgi:hypothetical protein